MESATVNCWRGSCRSASVARKLFLSPIPTHLNLGDRLQECLKMMCEEENNVDQHIQNMRKSLKLLLEDPLNKVCCSSCNL